MEALIGRDESRGRASNQPGGLFSPWRLAVCLALAISGLVYLPALSGQAIWDDRNLLNSPSTDCRNSFTGCFTTPFLQHYYRPLVTLSFYLDRKLWNGGLFFYHQTNILLHVLTTAAVIGCGLAAYKSRRIALLCGLLFAVQPAQVSAVAWIGGRTDSLCALWISLFAWTAILAARSVGARRGAALAVSVFCFAAAIFTKEQSLFAIALVPLAFKVWRPECKPNSSRAIFYITSLYLGAVIAYAIAFGLVSPPLPEVVHEGPLFSMLEAPRSVLYYALLLFAPSFRWMHTMSLGIFLKMGYFSVLLGAVTAIGIALSMRWIRRVEPAAAWFLALSISTLVLVLNIEPVPSMLVSPYRASAAGVGAALFTGWLLARPWQWQTAAEARTRLLARAQWAGIAALLLWQSSLCAGGSGKWQNELTITSEMLKTDPACLWIRYNNAIALSTANKPAGARSRLRGMLADLLGTAGWERLPHVQAAISRGALRSRMEQTQGVAFQPDAWLAKLYALL
ncbi:MAG TPA: hypothetical protein VGS41_04620, partial [Chthonomonadales bacterium]|nr:hypothetical protein [Chthonomonadales bacterium]